MGLIKIVLLSSKLVVGFIILTVNAIHICQAYFAWVLHTKCLILDNVG